MNNLTVQYLKEHGKTLDDYIECCGELVDDVIHWLGEERVIIMFIEGIAISPLHEEYGWRWHMVPIIDGYVHDAWFPDLVLPPGEYVKQAFPNKKYNFNLT